MKRLILCFLIILGAGSISKTFAQEDLLWKWNREADRQIASNDKSRTVFKLQPEEMIGLEDPMMQEQAEEGVEQEEPPTGPEQQEEVPVIEEEKDNEESPERSEPPAMLLQRPDEGSPANVITLPTLQPAISRPIEQKSSKEEDSVLEFNFLYMLIQKFKLSEIMD